MNTFKPIHSSSLGLQANTYIYKIARIGDHLAIISSDDSLLWVDPSSLSLLDENPIRSCHRGITCLETYNPGLGTVATCGRDAITNLWDLRLQKRAKGISLKREGFDQDLISLACNASAYHIATGAEYSSRAEACLTIWDVRNPSTPFRVYSESHSDDITSLEFHPNSSSTLLSGSTDGLVNIYNLAISDEDEAVIKTFNHGSSIHHSHFLGESSIAALSHDETFTIYDNTAGTDVSPSLSDADDTVFGDLRPILDCEYVVDIYTLVNDMIPAHRSIVPYLATGNTSQQSFTIHPLTLLQDSNNPGLRKWSLTSKEPRTEDFLYLKGGHSSDIVRTVYMDNYLTDGVIFTGGEDGLVKAWLSDSTTFQHHDEKLDEDMEDNDDPSNIPSLPTDSDSKNKEKPSRTARDEKASGSSKSSRYRPY